ncbi:FOG: Transposon-encoded proteins with TYA, reverse transcriptase, integrase domains in various combinations [Phaffia rhodozyma]|uniref:FOG: Transposon-encoded proteins with TYA, reverse transcriptase, integrase domains in various combinations n=1 Tax=Phaffia rhodozyma TaxID=264483 RepID=A0A0F7SXX9_PHARH|nr:FOG: Transposon-encoded proteins with TYA, reverse transcriptase, integrase domains in various combinations [Phaffia rhodozyma]
MPFGLTNAPATFQEFMNDIFRDLLDDFVIIYLDDILIFSADPSQHEEHVKEVLSRLRDHKLYAKLEKCEFDTDHWEFLGFVVSDHGVTMDKGKVQTVLDWPEPTSIKQLQAFLGFANFYRRFIPCYSRTCVALTRLRKKDVRFSFDQSARKAFETLKNSFASASVLAHFDPEKPISLETDASSFAIAGVLSQPDTDGRSRPIAFHSRKMNPAECNYEIYDKELLAIVDSFKVWRHDLEGSQHPIQIYSDHKNLQYFHSTKMLNRRQVRWSMVLNSYKYVFNFRPGKKNTKVSAFTRRHDYTEGGNARASDEAPQLLLRPVEVSPFETDGAMEDSADNNPENALENITDSATSDIATRVKAGYQTDNYLTELLPFLKNPSRQAPVQLTKQLKKLTLEPDGLILYQGLVYVPDDQDL